MKRFFILISAITILLTCISPSIAETTFAEITLITYVRPNPAYGKQYLFIATAGSQFEVVSERDIWIEIRVDETTTGFIPKNSCRIFHQTLNGFKQMTMEEFDTRVMELRETFLPLAREFRGKITEIDSLFFIASVDSCMDILDELMTENDDIKTKYPLYNNSSRIHIIMYIINGIVRDSKLEVDFSQFVYDEKDREEIKQYCDLAVKMLVDLNNRKLDKNTVMEFIDLFESRPSSLGNRGLLASIVALVKTYIENYIQFATPKKDADKYILRENKDVTDFAIRESIVLDKNSDNITELLLYLFKQIDSYIKDVDDEMLEFDENYLAQRKERYW